MDLLKTPSPVLNERSAATGELSPARVPVDSTISGVDHAVGGSRHTRVVGDDDHRHRRPFGHQTGEQVQNAADGAPVQAPRSLVGEEQVGFVRQRSCQSGKRHFASREGSVAFRDRVDAGQQLAKRLNFLHNQNIVVLGLPRGGVPVAYQIALALSAPLDVIVVRKLGVPFQPELGMGAVTEGDVFVVKDDVVRMAGVSVAQLSAVVAREKLVIAERAAAFRRGRAPIPLDGRTAVIVDDGMATGSTARAACGAARARGAARVILAVPVANPEVVFDLGREAEVVCLQAPRNLWAVSQWYDDFTPTSDDEVVELLERRAENSTGARGMHGHKGPSDSVHPGSASTTVK